MENNSYLDNSEIDKVIFKLFLNSIASQKACDIWLSDITDWERVQARARILGVNSQLLDWVNQTGLNTTIPKGLRSTLEAASVKASLRNHELYRRYQQICKNVSKAGIQTTGIKGMWLHRNFSDYSNNRITSDIDLLVSESELQRVAQILLSLNYKQDPVKTSRSALKPSIGGHHLAPFRNQDLAVELHYKVYTDCPDILNERILKSDRFIDHYLVIINHFLRHLGRGDFKLKWLCDIVYLTHSYQGTLMVQIENERETLDLPTSVVLLIANLEDLLIDNDQEASVHKLFDTLRKIHNSHSARPYRIREFIPVSKVTTRHFMDIVFPSPKYLRFINPEKKNTPLILMYPMRWIQLFARICLLIYGNIVVSQGLRHISLHFRNSGLIKRMGT